MYVYRQQESPQERYAPLLCQPDPRWWSRVYTRNYKLFVVGLLVAIAGLAFYFMAISPAPVKACDGPGEDICDAVNQQFLDDIASQTRYLSYLWCMDQGGQWFHPKRCRVWRKVRTCNITAHSCRRNPTYEWRWVWIS